MMKLSTMYAVDSAVDANGKSLVVKPILKHWKHDRESIQFFRASANFVYTFYSEGKRYFLRFASTSERTREAIEAEIDILQWVAGVGMTVATPIPSIGGNFVETVDTDLGTFHAVVFAELKGSQLDIRNLADPQFREWGAALGKLHAAMQSYTGPGIFARKAWKDHLASVRASLPESESVVCSEFEQLVSLLNVLPVTHATYGLVHFDFELDNLYWRDQAIGIGDFDDCSYAWYIADIAFALRDLFSDDIDLDKRSFREFIYGYSIHFPLDEELLSHLPTFLRMTKIFTYSRLVRAMDVPDHPDNPEWLRSLCLKLENWINAYRASLVGA